jgi:hypothetical protein
MLDGSSVSPSGRTQLSSPCISGDVSGKGPAEPEGGAGGEDDDDDDSDDDDDDEEDDGEEDDDMSSKRASQNKGALPAHAVAILIE